jgi:uncharacterized membrane protein
MTLEPLLHAPLAVQLHVATIVPAWIIGTWVMFFSKRGSKLHRALGIAFFALLTTTAFIALFIHRAMPKSPVFGMSWVHLTVIWTLILVWLALEGIWSKKPVQHRLAVIGLYGGSLTITAIVNAFTPHHLIHQLFAVH